MWWTSVPERLLLVWSERLVNPLLNKIDALLTLTRLSLLAAKTVLQFGIPSSQSQSLTNRPADHWLGTKLAHSWWRQFEKAVRSKKEPSVPCRSVNPATGEVLKNFPEHTDQQMWNALATADKAFRTWAAHPFTERSKIIARSAQILLERKEELARLATLEMGKLILVPHGHS
jgi:delta 1-pyrroline-5-carboxylate dehydrogenase